MKEIDADPKLARCSSENKPHPADMEVVASWHDDNWYDDDKMFELQKAIRQGVVYIRRKKVRKAPFHKGQVEFYEEGTGNG